MQGVADPTDLDTGPRAVRESERLCALTRQIKPLSELIRFVIAPDGSVVPDVKRKLPGRGLWISASCTALDEALRRKIFVKNFSRNASRTLSGETEVRVAPTLVQDTERLLTSAAVDALAMAGKAGLIVAGFAKVERALTEDQAVALIHASDAAPDGVRKLTATGRGSGRNSPDFPVITALTSVQLDLALGRSNVIHAAVLAGPAGATFLTRCQNLVRFRTPVSAAALSRAKPESSEVENRVRNLNA